MQFKTSLNADEAYRIEVGEKTFLPSCFLKYVSISSSNVYFVPNISLTRLTNVSGYIAFKFSNNRYEILSFSKNDKTHSFVFSLFSKFSSSKILQKVPQKGIA